MAKSNPVSTLTDSFVTLIAQLDELLDTKSDLSDKLCEIGDSIVFKLVQWTKRLPFYSELPVEVSDSHLELQLYHCPAGKRMELKKIVDDETWQVHTRLLTHKWHELLVLTTSAYQAIHGPRKLWSGPEPTEHDFHQQVRYERPCGLPLSTRLPSIGRPLLTSPSIQYTIDIGFICHFDSMLIRFYVNFCSNNLFI